MVMICRKKKNEFQNLTTLFRVWFDVKGGWGEMKMVSSYKFCDFLSPEWFFTGGNPVEDRTSYETYGCIWWVGFISAVFATLLPAAFFLMNEKYLLKAQYYLVIIVFNPCWS